MLLRAALICVPAMMFRSVSAVRICVCVIVIGGAILNADHGACIHFPFMSYLFKMCSLFHAIFI